MGCTLLEWFWWSGFVLGGTEKPLMSRGKLNFIIMEKLSLKKFEKLKLGILSEIMYKRI